MKLFKKVSAGLLLSFGSFCLLCAVAALFTGGTTQQDKQNAESTVVCGVVLGLPLTAAGGWIAWGLYKQGQKEVSDRLQSSFLKLLQAGNGRITVVQFAMDTQLPVEAAKQYLDEKAKNLNANFSDNEQGGVSYYFNI